MRSSRIGVLGLSVVAGAAVTTIGFLVSMKPASMTGFAVFSAWLVSPHAVMAAALLLLERKGAPTAHWHIVAILVSAGGLLFLADVIFWHTDAQGAIAVMMTPLFQGAALAVLVPIAWALSKVRRTRPP